MKIQGFPKAEKAQPVESRTRGRTHGRGQGRTRGRGRGRTHGRRS